MWGTLPGIAAAVLIGALWRIDWGLDVTAGFLIAALPQAWFVIRGTRSREVTAAAWLALGKFSLAAAGFGLWFVFRPEANGFATVTGTAITVVATTLATYGLLRQQNTPKTGK